MNSGTMLENTTSGNGMSRKKRKSKNSDNQRPWAKLPDELLDKISSHMKIPNYLRFGRVCEDWRSYFLANNKRFTKSLPPLVCYISAMDQNTCLFYDLSDQNKYQATLPYFADKVCIGMSCGNIIMGELFNSFWFINPATGYQHMFSRLPLRNYRMSHSDRFLFASTGPNQDILIVVLSQSHHCIWFRRSSDTQWSAYNFASKALIVDIAICNARVHVLTTQSQIGILSLTSSEVRFLKLKCIPRGGTNARFVTSDDELFVVDFVPLFWLNVFKIDFSLMEWVKLDNLGEQALFLGDMMGIGISSTTRWAGCSNCVYYLPLASDKIYIYSCTGKYLGSIKIFVEDRNDSARLKCWYSLDQSYNIEYVRDE